jgi:hypothetical protein
MVSSAPGSARRAHSGCLIVDADNDQARLNVTEQAGTILALRG